MSEAPVAAGPAAGDSRRARILRRTKVGGAIAVVVAGLFWLASHSEDGAIVLAAGLALSALACWEFQRMGGLAGARWGWVLGASWVVSAALGWYALDVDRARNSPYVYVIWETSYEPELWLEAAVVAMLAVIVRAVASGWGRRGSVVGSSLLALWTAFVVVVFLAPWLPWRPSPLLFDGEFGIRVLALTLVPAALLGAFTYKYWGQQDRTRVLLALWIGPLLALPLPWLWHVWHDWGTRGLVALVVLAKSGDIAGYYVGSAIGVRRPFPRISPGKTVAGCWGSFLAGTIVGWSLVLFDVLPSWGPLGHWGGLIAGAAVNLAAQAGDLLESWIKRGAGVKDSGTWFGPSGGVLDLVDSLLLAVPTALLVWPLVLA